MLSLHSKYPDTDLRRLLLLIVVERQRVDDHFLVQAGGMKHVELAVLPDGEAQVGRVESGLRGNHGEDVAVFHDAQRVALPSAHQPLGNVSVALARTDALVVAYLLHKRRVVLQVLILLRMGRHVVDVHRLHRVPQFLGHQFLIERRWLGVLVDALHQSQPLVVLCPPREVVQPARVVRQLALTVAQHRQPVAVIPEGALVVLVAQCQCGSRLHQRGAVKLVQVHDEVFPCAVLQRVCHVGQTQKLLGKVNHSALLASFMLGLL